jgi:small-conductance mechanosensitive channel
MNALRRVAVIVPALVLAVLLVLLFVNRGAMQELAFLRHGQTGEAELVDQRPWQTATTLAGLAVSAEEQRFAQDAERLADHEVDQAFQTALRETDLRPRPVTAEAAALAKKVEDLKTLVKNDQAAVDSYAAAARTGGITSTTGDDLDVAQAQLGLDKDELSDAVANLARATGDQRAEIQRELAAREAAMKKAGDGEAKKQTAALAVRQYGTLLGRLNGWFAQRSRVALLEQAEQESTSNAAAMRAEHAKLEVAEGGGKASVGALTGGDRVAALKTLSARRVAMSILDDRLQTDQELAAIYRRWQTQVWVQHHIVSYLLLQSFAWIALIVLAAVLGRMFGLMAVRRVATETRRRRTLETIVTLAANGIGLLGILLMIFGTPQQMPTILGLATAGITVVFQDFILGFIGWFALMGKDGIRVGDWVEINSVSGEVAEISLFRTVLLETGNWTTNGHPTGRRMSFSNSFALKGQFFNFSTNGQWMWDEISINVPATANAYNLIKTMQAAVEKEMNVDTRQAEIEWQRVAKDIGVGQFNAKPTVELRPAAAGVDIVVRFVTRASERFGMRNKINATLLGLMAGTERPELKAGA